MAEQAGLGRPYRMQSLLGRSSWNAEKLRDLVRAEVIASLGDPRGVLVVDETGFLKKGTHFGRRRSAVFRDGRADRELPGWRLSRLREPAWSGADRSAALSQTPAAFWLPSGIGHTATTTRSRIPSAHSPAPTLITAS